MTLQDCSTSNREADNWECCLLAQSYNNMSSWQDTTLKVSLRAELSDKAPSPARRLHRAPVVSSPPPPSFTFTRALISSRV